MKKKEKKIIILSILGTLLLLSIAVAGSYAYFVANVSGNKDTNNVVVTNGVMSLEYKDGDEINLANAVPGSSVSKTFTVKNTGNVSTNYTIYFSELINKFVDKTDLVYTLTSTDGGKSVAQTQVPDSNEAMVTNYEIEAGKTHTYTLTITFLNKAEVQDDNQVVSFSTKIGINEFKKWSVNVLGKEVTEYNQIALDDQDNNIRYIGANPDNYVYFNCSDYSNQSDSTCEKWRIIGVFKNVTKSDGTKEDLVKIIRNDSIGDLRWDSNFANDWSTASLQTTLNGEYYNGTYATGALKNDSTRNAIESVVWNLGGTATFDSSSNSLASHWYGYERGTTVYSEHATTWPGKIALMYPSDYGYATSGGSTTDRTSCLATMLYYGGWNKSSDCYSNDYLYKSGYEQWTLTPHSSNSGSVFFVESDGGVTYGYVVYYGVYVRPAAFLKSNISITSGDGSNTGPYQLNLN